MSLEELFGKNKENKIYFSFDDDHSENATADAGSGIPDPNAKYKTNILLIGENKQVQKLLEDYSSSIKYTSITDKEKGREELYSKKYNIVFVDPKIDKELLKNFSKDLASSVVTMYNSNNIKEITTFIKNNYQK
jgi:hypothetical protein